MSTKYQKSRSIQWYRSAVDAQTMGELMRCSDWQGFRQAGGHLVVWLSTGLLAYWAFRQINVQTWFWSVPLLLAGLFVHGTVGSFFGGAACHELSHKTPFKSKAINEFFHKVFAFFSWWDLVWFRPSHIRHHQVTVHRDYDGEVVLPQELAFRTWQFWLGVLAWNPVQTGRVLRTYWRRAWGKLDSEWYEFVMPSTNPQLRRQHRDWARFALLGHLALAALFIASGHWFLIVVFTFGTQYCGWLGFLCGMPQHYGMSPDVPDHRLSCRTFTCSAIPAFLYWNMQYHIEHHMFPAVPFYNLGRLRAAIAHDLPPAPHGLWATWRQMLQIHRRTRSEPNYCFVPELPKTSTGSRADDALLEREAATAASV